MVSFIAAGAAKTIITATVNGRTITAFRSRGSATVEFAPTGALLCPPFVSTGSTTLRFEPTSHIVTGFECDGVATVRFGASPDMSENEPIRIGVTLSGSYKHGEGNLSE